MSIIFRWISTQTHTHMHACICTQEQFSAKYTKYKIELKWGILRLMVFFLSSCNNKTCRSLQLKRWANCSCMHAKVRERACSIMRLCMCVCVTLATHEFKLQSLGNAQMQIYWYWHSLQHPQHRAKALRFCTNCQWLTLCDNIIKLFAIMKILRLLNINEKLSNWYNH